jgi:hypothetical protein
VYVAAIQHGFSALVLLPDWRDNSIFINPNKGRALEKSDDEIKAHLTAQVRFYALTLQRRGI